MRKRVFAPVALGVLLLAGCSSSSASSPSGRFDRLTSKACADIVSTMAPKTGTAIIRWNTDEPDQSPFQKLAAAVRGAPSATLHSELAAFETAAASGDVPGVLKASGAMVHSCRQFRLGRPAGR
jgi:hypothetical protein